MRTGDELGTLTRRFTLVALLIGAMLTSSLAVGPPVTEAAQGVDQVRDVGVSWVAGPVQLTRGGSALARVWLPPVQRGVVRLTYFGDGGEVGQVDVEMPAQAGAFFEVVVEAAYDGKALSIKDGTSNTIVFENSQGVIAIVIGLLTPHGQHERLVRRPMATLQILRGPGQAAIILPFIAQDN